MTFVDNFDKELLESHLLEEQEEYGMIILKWILRK
jgi:hypothetical protein